MKFLKAQQQIGNMVADVERFIQEENYSKDDLLLVCTEAHRSNCESMVDIPIDTINPEDLNKESTHPLAKYELEEDGMDLYDDMITRGGFILLAKDGASPDPANSVYAENGSKESEGRHAQHTKKIDKRTDKSDMSSSEDVTPPGFGVDFNEPKSDASTHEDVFNPEDPDPDNHRR